MFMHTPAELALFYKDTGALPADDRFDPALGADFAGWGDSFADLANSGRPDLVVATGGIPVTSLKKDAGPVKVIAPLAGEQVTRFGVAPGVAPRLRVNGRGLAAADVDNDGRVEIAVNSIGGKLLLLKPTGPVGLPLPRIDNSVTWAITWPGRSELSPVTSAAAMTVPAISS